ERKLKEEGQDRRDLGREKFVERVWEWKEEHGGIIFKQLQKLGASCDWDRQSFTLDEGYAEGVLEAFVRLYRRGYIYRGLRMSNWCPKDQTALSNEEVEMRPQQGQLYKMRYELVEPATGPDGVTRTHLEISTTRPETIMGDTAVAVHPDDERYQHLVGKSVWRPFPRAPIPIIADAAVDLDFGTGCLKVTPAHDTVDFEIGKRHDLPILDVLNPDGTLNDLAGPDFVGMDRFEARKKAAKLLLDFDLLVATEPYENAVGFSERGGVPIEPRLTEQWWLRYPKVDEAKRAVDKGIIQFHPKRWEKTYMHWLGTMQREGIDWCISRQLWWGHRIPVWYRKGADRAQWSDADYANPELVHVSLAGPPDPENWEQDTDVLDTWASSWLWCLANFGWPGDDPEKAKELAYFYPTSVLVTGFDIIFLWVARMIIAGLELHGDDAKQLSDEEIAARIPFQNVYITGLIRDGLGRKMSKSLGNSPDPLDIVAKYGADALRWGIVSIAPTGQDILYKFTPAEGDKTIEVPSAELGRNFCNKLWNAVRFRQMSGPAGEGSTFDALYGRLQGESLETADRWILGRLVETTERIEQAFGRYEMPQYADALYGFFWSDFCDWYLEIVKPRLRDEAQRDRALSVMDLVLRQSLFLLHPLTPFITEELFQALGFAPEGALLQDCRLATADALRDGLGAAGIELSATAIEEMEALKEWITRARALKAQYNVASRRDVPLAFLPANAASADLVRISETTLLSLVPAGANQFVETQPDGMPAGVTKLGSLFLDLSSSIDVEAERARLTKELAKLEGGIRAGEGKLKNEKFIRNAPPTVVEGARKQLAETQARYDELKRLLASLG
ncbi:MAG: valine--tRNA ligase, partial [Verrucomicrobiota bacterium]